MASDKPPAYTKEEEWVNTGTREIKVFHPTIEEFRDFPKYIEKIEREHRAQLAGGICKIVPPEEWTPRPSRPGDYRDVDGYMIDQPVKETIECPGATGVYIKLNKLFRKNMTVADFKKMATSKEYRNPKPDLSLAELERHYWKNVLRGEPVYGADTTGSLTEDSVEEFNMNKLGTILDLLKEKNVRIHGVNTVFLYFGMWKTTFPWHAEDMDLYSLNYLHFGAPKFWYAIPPHAAERFERLASQQFSSDGPLICKAFLRHKVYMLSPQVLRKNSIPFGTMVQYPNEFIVTFPKGYHMGFNTGYNCAESTNFAIDRWIDFGKNCVLCYCRPDGVQIDMRPFMEKFRPDEYSSWNDYWYGERPTCVDDEKRRQSRKRKSSTPSQRSSAAKKSRSPLEVAFAERERQIKRAKKLVAELWSSLPNNFNAEKQYNVEMAALYPHCAVCQYFLPRRSWTPSAPRMNGAKHGMDMVASSLPESSRRYTSQQLFNKLHDISQSGSSAGELDYESRLLQCSSCKVAVHEECYSLRDTDHSPEGGGEWRCDRCSQACEAAIASASCVLCELRGGPLLHAHETCYIENSFIHCICAIVSPRAVFAEPERRRRPICSTPDFQDAHGGPLENGDEPRAQPSTAIKEEAMEPCTSAANAGTPSGRSLAVNGARSGSRNRSKFECEICENQSEDLVQCHTCVQNEEEGASLYHHITCASIAGMNYERRHHPTNVVCVCSFHNNAVIGSDNVIALNEKVAVELEPDDDDGVNGEAGKSGDDGQLLKAVKRGRVVDISENLHCTVDFLDGSTSNDISPEDIKKCECYRFGCEGDHIAGSLVYVEWDDELLYEGYCRGKAPSTIYKVELDPEPNGDGTKRCVEVRRDNVYSLAEPMPDEIMSALAKEE